MKRTLLILALFALPAMASAANHKYTCTDLSFREGAPSCSGGIVTFSGSDQEVMDSDSAGTPNSNPVFPLADGTTYYVYLTAITGTGKLGGGSYKLGGGGFGNEINFNWQPNVSGLGNSFTSIRPNGSSFWIGHSSGATPEYSGNIGPICISDVSAADAQNLCSPAAVVTPPPIIWFDTD
jgi:hypothetical protein